MARLPEKETNPWEGIKPDHKRKITVHDDYSDIMNMERPVSKTRKHMSDHDRAAQFAPFAALTGFGGMIDEASDMVNYGEVPEEPAVKVGLNQPVTQDIDPDLTLTIEAEEGQPRKFDRKVRRMDQQASEAEEYTDIF